MLENLDEIYRLQSYENMIFYYFTDSQKGYFNDLTMTTQLYYLDIDTKQNEKIYFKTKE